MFTFREGLLARLAHDLRLRVAAFEITLQRGEVRGSFDASSLRVDGVAEGERVDPERLSAEDKAKIEHTVRTELLNAAKHPRIELRGVLRESGKSRVVEGTLRIKGIEQPVQIPLLAAEGGTGAAEGGTLSAELAITPSRFDIKPYRAIGGAIRLRDRVVIRVLTALADPDNLAALAASDQPLVFCPAPSGADC